ncbi:MAG: glycosyltransferase family 2 protein [Clostridia bacterium]|nr:glycosyltransferase family 2 protein [Clostridia bacterium]
MKTLSICMIVKNEEQTLERILKQAQQFADEIIIVDTGSIDSTISIAKKYTDKIFTFAWCDDFSKARNFSLSKATKDYSMWLDADDNISNENILKIQKLKESLSADIYMCKYIINSNNSSFQFYRERIFKTSLRLKFEGFIHEAIPLSGNIQYTDIEVEHKKEKPNDPKRNFNIYKKALLKGIQFNPREQYYFSRELYYLGKYTQCITNLKKYFKMHDSFIPNIIGAYTIIADCYIKKNQHNLAKKELLKIIYQHPPTAEICCKLAHCYENERNINLAIFWYKCALNAPQNTLGFEYAEYRNLIPNIELSRLLYHSDKTAAKHYHQQAKQENPNHPSVIYNEQFFNKSTHNPNQ